MHCLRDYPQTRNSDITLMIVLWKEFFGVRDSVDILRLYDLPREDRIKRIRARIQNEKNMYLPTSWEVAKQRKIEESKWRSFLGYPPINKI